MPTEDKKSAGIKIPINLMSVGIVLLVIAGVLLYFQFNGKMNGTVKVGDMVSIDYVGTLENGTVFDTSKESVAVQSNLFDSSKTYAPLEFTVGSGDLIKGFDNAVIGMKVGNTKKVTLQPGDAYGDIQQDLIVNVNASKIETNGSLSVGGVVFASNGLRGVITGLKDSNATIDFNSPLAGKVLNFEITLVKIIK